MARQLTSKERVLTAFSHQEPDRVPVDYLYNPGIDARLKQHYGLAANDNERLLQALNVDFRGVWVPYVGPKLHPDLPGVHVDNWGIHRRWVEHDTGGYWDYCDFPLKDATLEEIANWPMPSPDDFDYSRVADRCTAMKEYCVTAGGAGTGDIINSTGMIRTMQRVLEDLITDDPALMCYIDRKVTIDMEVLYRTIEASRGGVDVLCMGEDLGTQIAPMISLKLYRKQLRPRHQRIVDIGKHFNIPVMVHTCGSSSWAYDDFIEMGVSVVDTLQPEAKNMAPAYLKQRFGGKLAFHGCISTAGPVAYGTVDDVVANVRETLATMMPGGGYALAPTHQLQDNSPTENVVAMYESARQYGVY
jgi:uroporphyrinogen decarboxylase